MSMSEETWPWYALQTKQTQVSLLLILIRNMNL